jgi:hypothetical protein
MKIRKMLIWCFCCKYFKKLPQSPKLAGKYSPKMQISQVEIIAFFFQEQAFNISSNTVVS